MEIPIEMFPRYFVVHTLNRSVVDVPSLHVCVDVRLPSKYLAQFELQAVALTSKNQTRLAIIRLRQPFFGLDALYPETTSTRIPLLSP